MDPTPKPTREEAIAALIAELGCTRAGAEQILAGHGDLVEVGDDDLDVTIEEE